MTRRIGISTCMAMALAGPPAAFAQGGRNFVLELSGAGAVAFEGECQVEDGGETRTVRFAGTPPFSRTLRGDSLSCSVHRKSGDGLLEIRVHDAEGNVSRSSTRGLDSRVTIRLD